MLKKLPNYAQIEQFYPTDGTVADMKSRIGGDVDQKHYTNSKVH